MRQNSPHLPNYLLPNTYSILNNLLFLHSPTITVPSKQKNRPLPSNTSPLKVP